ncbi:MAG TPA: glycosyltransferase [Phycisphaerales bacterium]|nr:glycosyltransferase [Phycisphaerales bacterium]
MRALILADMLFASRERSLLSRLELGLADEGVRVTQAVPAGVGAGDPALFREVVTFEPAASLVTGMLSSRRLVRSLAPADTDEEPVNIVHVFGGSAWKFGARVAESLDAGLVLEVWRSGMGPQARRVARHARRCTFMAPDEPLRDELKRFVPPSAIRVAPWGVIALDPAPVLPADRAPSLMLIGSGRDAHAFAAALEAIARVVKDFPDILVFCDAQAARRGNVWSRARDLQLLNRLSLVEDLEGRRPLVLSGDLLIEPEAAGERRSVVIEAMARGMIVLAAADPRLSSLKHGVTARLVEHHRDPRSWQMALRAVLSDPQAARTLGSSAHEYVAAHHRASTHVRAVLEAYQALR